MALYRIIIVEIIIVVAKKVIEIVEKRVGGKSKA